MILCDCAQQQREYDLIIDRPLTPCAERRIAVQIVPADRVQDIGRHVLRIDNNLSTAVHIVAYLGQATRIFPH